MSEVRILLGLDCDRPRIRFASYATYSAEREKVAAYLAELTAAWAPTNTRWTMFLCGQFVEAMMELTASGRDVAGLLGRGALGCEIACHSYDHAAVAPVIGRPDLEVGGLEQMVRGLERNSELLSRVLGCDGLNIGFRAPYGLHSEQMQTELLAALTRYRSYSSSWLRTPEDSICPPLIYQNGLRQPHLHSTGLPEIPSHGWHDTVFAGISQTAAGYPAATDAFSYYCGLVEYAKDLAEQFQRTIYLGLVLHPFAMLSYDPHFELRDRLADVAGNDCFRTYGDVAQLVRAGLMP